MGCRNEGMEYSLGREWFGGVLFFDFPSSSTFPRGGGLFVLINLDGKCHGLVHDGKFSFEGFLYCNESIRSKSYM